MPSQSSDPATPPSQYYLASEETPAGPSRIAIAHTPEVSYDSGEHPSASSSSYESGTTFDDLSEEEEEVFEDDRPLVSRRRDGTSRKDGGLLELVAPLILAHPLPLLPLLPGLPYSFLPGGVVLFIPITCVLAGLSACAHIVIVYLASYLKVHSFEEVFGAVAKSGYGLWAGRIAVMVSVVGLVSSWLGTLYPLMEPMLRAHLHPVFWTIALSTLILPSLLPLRINRNIIPALLGLCVPIVVFLVIGRTVEIHKEEKRSLLESGAGAGITTLITLFSPHINTLSIHSTLERTKRSSFPIPCLATSISLLALALPFALVPYYLLDPPNGPFVAGIFAQLPFEAGVNAARVLMCALILGTSSLWIQRGRDSVVSATGATRQRARWIGLAIWLVVVLLACIGGVVADVARLLGVVATLAVSWFLPALFFIITFHVRSPLAIVFPSKHPPTEAEVGRHSRHSSLDPTMDILLARKERQLQKRRTGRRLWQDLLVYVGILPVGALGILWTLGNLIGVW